MRAWLILSGPQSDNHGVYSAHAADHRAYKPNSFFTVRTLVIWSFKGIQFDPPTQRNNTNERQIFHTVISMSP